MQRYLRFSAGLLGVLLAFAPAIARAQSCGVERWSVKTGTDADVSLVNLSASQANTIATLRSWPAPSPIPANNRVSPYETTVWVLNATLVQYKLENDSDYHLVLQDANGLTMIAEIPSPSCVGSSSPFLSGITHARSQFDAVYTATTSFQTANVPVRVTGIGMFDFLHGQTGVAPNGIELHPVIDIQFNPGSSNTVTASISSPASNVTIASGTAVSFSGSATDSSSSATLSYSWNFGDGSSVTGASASHTYTNTGTSAATYTATFTATDNTGVSSSATRTVTVNPPAANTVTASITTPSGNVTIASGTNQSFVGSATDSSSSATLSYAWTFGDGGTASTASASHTYTNTGTSAVSYTATLKVTDNTGVSSTATRTITVNPASVPVNTVTASITTPSSNVTIASGASQAFAGSATDSSSTATLSYAWNFGDGTTATGASASHVFTNTGTTAVTRTVTFTATDSTGVSNSATRTVTVNPAPSGGGTQLLVNPGFENGNVSWSNYSTVGGGGAVVSSDMTNEPSHSGSWDAWLNGYGSADTDTLSQNVAIPSTASTATLSFWLHIDTAETSTTTAYDKLVVQVQTSGGTVLATLATFSNLNAASGYTQYTYDLSAYKGQTVKIYLKGTEDASYQTSFVVDDFSLNVQ